MKINKLRPALALCLILASCPLKLALAADAPAPAHPATPTTAAAPEPSPAAAKAIAAMIAAIGDDNYLHFLGSATFEPGFNKAITQDVFKAMSAHFAPLLKKGYTNTYLGELHEQGYTVSLFKLSFTAGGDDALVELSIKDGSVGDLSFS